ncbi:MAG: type II secretion system F family protein [Raoultibacter sp.]
MATEVLACLGFIAAFFTAFFLVPETITRLHCRIAKVKVQRRAVMPGGLVSVLLRNGIAVCNPCARIFLKSGRSVQLFEDARMLCCEKGMYTTVQNLCSLLCASVAIVMLAGGILARSLVFGITLGMGVVAVFVLMVHRAKEKRITDMREAIPDTLRSMSVCFHAGLSLGQTFRQLEKETEGPLKTLFTRAANDLETGHTAQEALRGIRENSATNELVFIAVALDVQHKAGGSLQQVLDTASDSIRSELALRRSLRVQTAQAKLSARVVSVLPFVLIGLFSLISPGFLAPFFQNFAGVALLGLAIGMQVMGVFAVRRLLDVEVR